MDVPHLVNVEFGWLPRGEKRFQPLYFYGSGVKMLSFQDINGGIFRTLQLITTEIKTNDHILTSTPFLQFE